MTTVAPLKPEKLRWKPYSKGDFYSDVKKKVDLYFKENHLSPHADKAIWIKGIVLTSIYLSCYAGILSNHFQLMGLMLLYGTLGLTKGLIGFNLIHDALHGALTSSPFWNRFIGYWFDLNGTSSHIWKVTHNVLHHTFTNIPGHDHDIDKAIILRLNPSDKPYWFHRFQQWYAPVLYGLIGFNWVFYSDLAWFIRQRRQGQVKTKDFILFSVLKAANITLFLILPLVMLSVPWWQVLIAYSCMHIVAGISISIVFQLAHLVENVHFLEPDREGNMTHNWAVHELLTTSDFARDNKVVTTLVGGLNFQVEHHLFPMVSHCHYPALSKIVEATAKEYQIPFNEQSTFFKAIKSHFVILKKLGAGARSLYTDEQLKF